MSEPVETGRGALFTLLATQRRFPPVHSLLLRHDMHAVIDLICAIDDDTLTRLQTGGDLDPPVAAGADFDRACACDAR